MMTRQSKWSKQSRIALALAMVIAHHSSEAANVSPFERFKQFVQQPPVVADIVYMSNVGPLGSPDKFNYYHCRWQTNAFYRRQLPSLRSLNTLEVMESGRFISRFGNTHWTFETGKILSVFDRSDPSSRAPLKLHSAWEDSFSSVLNMGVANLPIGSITFSDNKYSAISPISGSAVSLQLFPTQSFPPLPSHLHVIYRSQGIDYSYVVKYGFERRGNIAEEYLPDRISVFRIQEGVEHANQEFRILYLKTSLSPLPQASFDPTVFATQKTRRLVYTNNWVSELSRGTWKPLAISHEATGDVTKSQPATRFFYIALALLSLITILAFKVRLKSQKQTSTHHENIS